MNKVIRDKMEQFIIGKRILPVVNENGEIVSRYSLQDIKYLLEKDLGIVIGRTTIKRICDKYNISEKFNEVKASMVKDIVKDDSGDKALVAPYLEQLQKVFEMDLKIITAISKINSNYINTIINKIKAGQDLSPYEVRILSAIGDSSSNRVMKLLEVVVADKKRLEGIKVEFKEGIDFDG